MHRIMQKGKEKDKLYFHLTISVWIVMLENPSMTKLSSLAQTTNFLVYCLIHYAKDLK